MNSAKTLLSSEARFDSMENPGQVLSLLNGLALSITLAAAVPIPPVPTQPATDTAGVLSAATLAHLDSELSAFHRASGHRVLVWIGQTTGDAPLEEWTLDAANQWKPGNKKRDDGAILFLFMRDHKIRIEVGYGLESSLTDAQTSRIIRDTIAPRLRAGNVDGAVQAGVDQMLLVIAASSANSGEAMPEPASNAGSIAPALVVVIFVFLFAFVALFVMLLARATRRGGPGRSSGGGESSGFSSSDDTISSSDDDSSSSDDDDGGSFGGGGSSGSW
jgi:uncharacterized protein